MSDNTPTLRHDLKIILITLIGIVLVCVLAVKGVSSLKKSNDEMTAKKYKKSVLKKPRRRA
jgi:hypothetical protein